MRTSNIQAQSTNNCRVNDWEQEGKHCTTKSVMEVVVRKSCLPGNERMKTSLLRCAMACDNWGTWAGSAVKSKAEICVQSPSVCKDPCSDTTLKSCYDHKDGEFLRVHRLNLCDVYVCPYVRLYIMPLGNGQCPAYDYRVSC